jgi:hypothetical protein
MTNGITTRLQGRAGDEVRMKFADPIQQDVWEFVQELNRAWTTGHPERLTDFFHTGMVAHTPGAAQRLESGAACVAGWTSFVESALIHSWKEDNPLVRIHAQGSAAVVAYEYTLNCELAGSHHELKGRDLFFLVQEDGRWWVVADQFSN